MDRGYDFHKSQVNNLVMQHQTFLRNLEDHEGQAEDTRYRDLCSRFIPTVREHQRMIDEYQQSIGAETGVAKKALGAALGLARNAADAVRESDFLRLVGDIVTSRQSQDTFYTMAEVGRATNDERLQQIGETGQRHHEEYAREANRLVVQLYLDHMRGTDAATHTSAGTSTSTDYRPSV
jgi:hypothetical protein